MRSCLLILIPTVASAVFVYGAETASESEQFEIPRNAITRVECDTASGSLNFTVNGRRLTYQPPAVARARRTTDYPVVDQRQHRLMECLALQRSLQTVDRVAITLIGKDAKGDSAQIRKIDLINTTSKAESGKPSVPDEGGAMPKFEYFVTYIEYGKGKERLNELGRDGWELVAVHPLEEGAKAHPFYFKRKLNVAEQDVEPDAGHAPE